MSHPYDQCDETCTVDCGHCKGEARNLIARGLLARCDSTGRTFHVGHVEVVQRYADCSVFICPSCGGKHDDRPSWGGPSSRRMGYSLVEPTELRWSR